MQKAFTLIELLVVVLIIGILSAVALPQYQRAVDKSRFSQALIWAKAIKDAEQVYYMENGRYTPLLEDLGVALPNCERTSGTATTANYYSCEKGLISIAPQVETTAFATKGSVYAYLPNGAMAAEFYFHNNTRLCYVPSKAARYVNICLSMGGTDYSDGAYFKLP